LLNTRTHARAHAHTHIYINFSFWLSVLYRCNKTVRIALLIIYSDTIHLNSDGIQKGLKVRMENNLQWASPCSGCSNLK